MKSEQRTRSFEKLKGEINMITYFVILALGLYFIYALRDALLILQNRRDAKAALQEKSASDYIITQNVPQCKRFEQAG